LLLAKGKTSSEVALSGCLAVVKLAMDKSKRSKLGSIGGCEAVTGALNAWGNGNKAVAKLVRLYFLKSRLSALIC